MLTHRLTSLPRHSTAFKVPHSFPREQAALPLMVPYAARPVVLYHRDQPQHKTLAKPALQWALWQMPLQQFVQKLAGWKQSFIRFVETGGLETKLQKMIFECLQAISMRILGLSFW
jgi:hypothetical protein